RRWCVVPATSGCASAPPLINNRNSNHNQKMKISKHKLTTVFSAAIVFGIIASVGDAAALSDQDKKFLTSYEKIHTALAADDLTGAKAAAIELGDSGTDIAKANSLQEARSAFEKLSGRAKTMIRSEEHTSELQSRF